MGSKTSPPRRWLSILAFILLLVGLGFLGMVPFSFMSYTSFGFDREYQKDRLVIEDFYRIRWPGDGSFRIGCGSIHYSIEEEDVDPIDLAARFLQPPQREFSADAWYRFEIATGLLDVDKGQLHSSTWLVTPSWFPACLILIYPLMRFYRSRTQARRSTDAQTQWQKGDRHHEPRGKGDRHH